ncbi:hypothetical protein JIG36_31220 [Actinoplanes sp. LDG1-06]|uniref:Uncharacterized protein n=1 Tax=Paractinoplanes ovalisporus TaxID=2810368 RepID=A0ABS2AJH8_9ACTN|nr:hypothetical protein [Actinoplanes ovalisporus]MBM2619994.1 hypothetical protein [Actinoplanes ovalisporus]
MHLTHITVAATVTLSIAAICYSQFDPKGSEQQARTAADKATCRAVDSAIVAYAGLHGEAPKAVSQIAGYLKGDITAYRIVNGQATGPGCS